MDRRFQVFVRSAGLPADTVRQAVVRAVISLGCTPVIADAADPSDAEHAALIRRLIDDCDYYLLILGERDDAAVTHLLRYTQAEFDHAASGRRDALCLVRNKGRRMPRRTAASDPDARAILKSLRSRAELGRTVRCWQYDDELPGLTALTLAAAIRSRPAVGWVRGNLAADGQLLTDLDLLRGENSALKEQLTRLLAAPAAGLAGLDDQVTLRLRSKQRTHPQWELWSATLSRRELFASIGPHLLNRPDDAWIRLAVTAAAVRAVGRNGFRHELDEDDFQSIKLHFRGLRLIELTHAQTPHGRTKLLWSLTPYGEQALLGIRAAAVAAPQRGSHPGRESPAVLARTTPTAARQPLEGAESMGVASARRSARSTLVHLDE